MSDDDNFWPEYLADRHQLSSHLSSSQQARSTGGWRTVVKPQAVKERCVGCNAQVVIQTDGAMNRLKPHRVNNENWAPWCVASAAEVDYPPM